METKRAAAEWAAAINTARETQEKWTEKVKGVECIPTETQKELQTVVGKG